MPKKRPPKNIIIEGWQTDWVAVKNQWKESTFHRLIGQYQKVQKKFIDHDSHDFLGEIMVNIISIALSIDSPKTRTEPPVMDGNVLDIGSNSPVKDSQSATNSPVVNGSNSPVKDSVLDIQKKLSVLTDFETENFNERKCVICGCDISDKKLSAKTCSKSCRNRKSNTTNNPLRAFKKDVKQCTLFDTKPFLDLSKLETRKRHRKKPIWE